MGSRRLLITLGVILAILILMPSGLAESPKNDVKIITSLEGGGFLTPALSENNTFVYNHFTFHLYSSVNNTTYRIIVDNITIASSIIIHFKETFYWDCSKSFIDLLEVYISDDYYSYSDIFIFTDSVVNRTVLKEKEKYKSFDTEEEFKQFVMDLELKAIGKGLVGCFCSFYILYRLVKKHKEGLTKRIL